MISYKLRNLKNRVILEQTYSELSSSNSLTLFIEFSNNGSESFLELNQILSNFDIKIRKLKTKIFKKNYIKFGNTFNGCVHALNIKHFNDLSAILSILKDRAMVISILFQGNFLNIDCMPTQSPDIYIKSIFSSLNSPLRNIFLKLESTKNANN